MWAGEWANSIWDNSLAVCFYYICLFLGLNLFVYFLQTMSLLHGREGETIWFETDACFNDNVFFCRILLICLIDCIFPWTMSLLCGRIWFEIANPLFGSMLVCLFVYHNLFICLFDCFFIMWVGLVWDCIPAVFKYLWPVFLSIAWFDYQRNDPPTNWVDW